MSERTITLGNAYGFELWEWDATTGRWLVAVARDFPPHWTITYTENPHADR